MYTRGLALLVVALAGTTTLTAAGCARSAHGATAEAAWVQPNGSAAAPSVSAAPSGAAPRTPVPTASPPSGNPPPASAGRSPTPTGTPTVAGSAPPWCHLADLRFGLEVGISGGSDLSASLTMTNVSGRRCAMTGYLTLTWRDAGGTVIPVTVTHMRDPQTAHTIAVPPGATALATIYWNRYRDRPPAPAVPCPPFPATIDAWLPPTVENPHPERGPAARVTWVAGDSAGLCAGTAGLRPVDII